ncbi:MAG: Fic family protein [Chloroflexota bacterium]|nr:Fic family protein [Chloroflexota bacterium]
MTPAAGVYRRSLQGHTTFVPDDLPPGLALSPAIDRAVEEATHLLGQVEMCRILLPNADLLIYSSLQREAIASSTIEDTIASPDELVRYQAAAHISNGSEREAVREVANYSDALSWGYSQLGRRPIGLNLILGLHERLLLGVRGAPAAGRLKDRQNYIGSTSSDAIDAALFVPPPPEMVLDLVTSLEKYINSPGNREPRIVQCALVHYQFETIHPFSDGNGRVGRLLIVLQMIQLGLLSAPLIYPSVYFERNRAEYYRHLQDVREHGAWDGWIDFFTHAIKAQCVETIAFTQTILKLQEQLHAQVKDVRRKAAVGAVLDVFFREPVLPLSEISKRAHLAANTVQAAVNILQEMKLVYEITGMEKRRIYTCGPVFDLVFGRQ